MLSVRRYILDIRKSAKKDSSGTRGSVTVEACISFPIFLCFFFVLLFLIKLACIDLVLEHTANETAKQLASAAYPMKFINELEDETFLGNADYKMPSFDEELKKAKDNFLNGAGNTTTDIFTLLISGEGTLGGSLEKNASELLNSFFESTLDGLKSGARAYITKNLGNKYYEIKSKIKYTAAKMVGEKCLKGSYLRKDKVEYLMVQTPQSTAEYEIRSRDSCYLKACRTIGYTPEKDDVVIALRYEVNIPIPFFNTKTITLQHVGVEKAWLKGSSGVYSKEFEQVSEDMGGSPPDGTSAVEESYRKLDDGTVYITNTGTKYHNSDCPCLRSSRKPIKLSDARSRGYGQCMVCSNKGRWNFYK